MTAAAEEAALLGLAPVAPDRTVAYGPHPDQIVDLYGGRYGDQYVDPDVDLYGPRAGAAPGVTCGPLVVLLHGGFWRAPYDRRHLSPLAAALAGHGLPVALAEYRRVGAGGGAPETFEDVTAAIEAAAGAEADLRPHGLVLIGHSAGGHLALLAAARPGTPVTRVIAVAPVADLARAHELGLSDGAVAELFGAGGAGPAPSDLAERIAAADPMRHPPPPGIPVTIIHGTDDPDVPLDISRRYAAAHPAATTLRELPGVGHYAPVTPGTPAFHILLATVLNRRRIDVGPTT